MSISSYNLGFLHGRRRQKLFANRNGKRYKRCVDNEDYIRGYKEGKEAFDNNDLVLISKIKLLFGGN